MYNKIMTWRIEDRGWPVPYTYERLYNPNSTKWSPYIYPTYTANLDIERIAEYQQLQKPKFYYDWTLGKNVDVWV